MLKDIESHSINCVIVKDLSRFGRDYIDTGKYLERYFPSHNVRFISITDNIDSIKQPYDLLLPIKNLFNEQYARDISEKIHASVSTKQKAGEFIGAFASYGYRKSPSDKNKLIIDEYAAGIIRQIFQLYIDGCGKQRIVSILNKQGIVCPSEYKKIKGENYRNSNRLDTTSYWTYSTVNRILHNELYIGNMVQGRKSQHMGGKPRAKDQTDWIVVKNTHEPIIDEITWKKTQNLLKHRTRTPGLHTNVSIFAGFLKCGDCGRSLTKKTSHTRQKGTLIHYYCGTYVRSGRQYCSPHSISHEFLENIILEDVRNILPSAEDLQKIIAQNTAAACTKKPPSETEFLGIKEELKKIQRIKQTLYEDYKEEFISKDEYFIYRQNYLKKEDLLTKQLNSIMKQQSGEPVCQIHKNLWIQNLLDQKMIDRLDRKIVVEMIEGIEVYKNHRIRILYNFSRS